MINRRYLFGMSAIFDLSEKERTVSCHWFITAAGFEYLLVVSLKPDHEKLPLLLITWHTIFLLLYAAVQITKQEIQPTLHLFNIN